MTERTRELFGPVTPDLAVIESELKRTIQDDPAEVAAPMADLFEAGGKRLRPALVLLSAMVGRYDLARLLPAATAVELTHAATLVHDDVIDRSAVRRGRPTIAARLGDEPAIVIGDFYFAKAYEQAARTDLAEVVAILARTVMKICAGEVRQQSIRYRYSTDRAEYMARIDAKTGELIAASCEIGALLGGLDAPARGALEMYGRYLGRAFQIADDVLDYVGSEDDIGKPIGHDIAEGFATLPLMLAREETSIRLTDGERLDDARAQKIVTAVRESGGPRRALEEARRHAQSARTELDAVPSSDAVDALASLTEYVVSRKF